MTLPLVAAGSVAYILFVNYVLVLIVAYATGTSFGVRILYAPLSLVLAVLVTALMAAVLSAIHVYFRDTKYIVQAVLIVAFYLTPVFYPLTRAPKALRIVDEINPMTGVIELLRRATSGADPSWATAVGVSCVWIVGLFVLALSLYRRRERTFSDLM
jgi:ABC-type polysaccharide/polyol phosphate export permease